MAGFVLQDKVEDLTYDFSPHGDKGVVPEPSSLQIQNFRVALSELFNEMPVPNVDDATPVAMLQQVSKYLGADTTEMNDKLVHAIADVCSDHPSYDDLSSLPFRAQQAFFGWVVGIFLVPQLPMPATTA